MTDPTDHRPSQPATASQPASQLRRFREASGLSRAALAEASGVSPSTIYETEAGTSSPRLATARALAHALGRSVAEVWPDATVGPDGHATHSVKPDTLPADGKG